MSNKTESVASPASALNEISRRNFIRNSLATGAAMALLPDRLVRAAEIAPEGRRLNVALVGIGNRGNADLKSFRDTGLVNFVAFCDVDLMGPHTAESRQLFPDVPGFQDFREMFAKMGDQFEAVIIATPDHTHFVVAMHAMAHGKHVYVEKPLAHTFQEIELLMARAKQSGVVTQMGNQGHSGNNYHQFKAWTEAGIIRDVTRIDMFMNSPRRWHGWQIDGFPTGEQTPSTIDWDVWHANTTMHPFSEKLHPGNWRSWFAYGDGAFGDWGPHILDTAHRFLKLGLPRVIEAVKRDGPNDFIFPQATTIRFDFAARGDMPSVEVFWYDGVKNLPPLPEGMSYPPPKSEEVSDPALQPEKAGAGATLRRQNGKFIYSKNLVFAGGTHSETLRIFPEEKMQALAPELPRIKGGFSDHFQNFALACLGREETRSPFRISGPLSQVFSLGVIAQRLGGRLEFDPVAKQFTNSARANELLRTEKPRPGWGSYFKG